jgi:hypothetical protein
VQRELNDEVNNYLDYVRSIRLKDKQKELEVNRTIQEDVDRAMEKQMEIWKATAAASRRLLCDVAAAQKVQREEKC